MPLRLRHQLEFSYRINLLSRKSELCDTFSKKPVPHAYLPIFDQILSLQISLVIKPSDLCELNDTGGRKGNQQRIMILMVRLQPLPVLFQSDLSLRLSVDLTPPEKTQKAEPMLALPLSIRIRF
jgi:hypothetical protein